MRTSLLLLGLLLALTKFSSSQVSIVRKNVSELFFGIQELPSKFDVRKLIHSDENFYGHGGWDYGNYETITTQFRHNSKLSNLGRDTKHLIFRFDDGSEISNSRKISTEYFVDEFSLCLKQMEELFSVFDKCATGYSESVFRNIKGEKNGEGWDFYSSEESYTEKKAFLTLLYRYFKLDTSQPSSMKKEGYIFEISLKDKNLY